MILITIAGPLGRDPETKILPSGQKVTSMSIATNIGYGDKKQTVWWNVSVWGDRFDKLFPHLKKGKVITVTGTMGRAPQIYNDKVSNLDLTAEIINFLPMEKREEPSAHQAQPAFREDQDNSCPF